MGQPDDKEVTKLDWARAIIYTLIMIGVIIWGAFLMLPSYWQLWLVVTAVLIYSLTIWHTRHFDYRCASCGEEFAISVLTDLVSPQGINKNGSWKYLKCPKCQVRTRARVIKKQEYPGANPPSANRQKGER